MTDVLALVGVTGGAGTTRVAVEVAATLARSGRSVAVVDAASGTQGLARYADGRIDPDLSAVLTEEAAFGDALVPAWSDLPGRAALAPIHAPFERLARARAPAAARRLTDCVGRARTEFDHVLVDVPPVADNLSVAGATGADRRALVAPAELRGQDLLPRLRGRLDDVGASADAVIANCPAGADSGTLSEADYRLPAGDRDVDRPQSADPDATLAPAVADAAGGLLDVDLDLEFPSEGLLG